MIRRSYPLQGQGANLKWKKKTIGLGMVIKSARIDEKMTKIYRNPNPERLFVMMSRGESKNENKRKNQENY